MSEKVTCDIWQVALTPARGGARLIISVDGQSIAQGFTFEPLGKRRKEFGEAKGRMATKRAGASESNFHKPAQG